MKRHETSFLFSTRGRSCRAPWRFTKQQWMRYCQHLSRQWWRCTKHSHCLWWKHVISKILLHLLEPRCGNSIFIVEGRWRAAWRCMKDYRISTVKNSGRVVLVLLALHFHQQRICSIAFQLEHFWSMTCLVPVCPVSLGTSICSPPVLKDGCFVTWRWWS